MKVSLFLLASVYSDSTESSMKGCKQWCTIKVQNREECQAICDNTSYCYAWCYDKETHICWPRKRDGWTVQTNSRYDAGFKNEGPWFAANTRLVYGDYCCD